MANNKVELADGTVLMDITDTTAVPSDVVSGKEFYGANGVKSTGSATYAGSPSAGGPATVTNGVHIAQVDSTSTSKVFTAQIPGITSYYDGLHILLYNGVVTSASGFTININGLGAYGAYNNMTLGNAVTPTDPTRETTIFNINYAMEFIFYSNIGGDGVSGWICYHGYDANTNTIGYQVRSNSSTMPTADKFYRYRLLFTSADGKKWVPSNTSSSTNATAARTVNQRPIDPFGEIVYYSSTTAIEANANPAAASLWQQYTLTLGYSFNRTGAALVLTYPSPIYIKAAPQSDGSAIIDADNPYVLSLPSTADGKIYIFLGRTYSATSVEILMNHPVYYHDGTGIKLWTNAPSVDTSSFLTQTDEKVWFRVGDIPDSQSEAGRISAIVNSSGNPATYAEVYGAYKKTRDVIVYSSAGISNQEITTATIGKIADINEYAQSISVTWYDGLNLGCMEFREGDAESEHSGVLVLTNSYQTTLGENLDLTTMLTEESYIKNVQIMDDGGETYIYDSYYGNLDYYTFAGIVDKSKGYDIQYGNYVCSLASFDYSNQIVVIDYIDTANGKKRLHELTFEEDSSYGVLTKQSETITIIPTKTSELTNDSGFITSAPVTSVNSQTGNVVLSIPSTASDVGAYELPSGGIPKTDLASSVQNSLNAADNAYQKPSTGIPASDLASGILSPSVNTNYISVAEPVVTLSPCPVTYDFGECDELTVTVTATTQYHFSFSCPSGIPTVLTINGATEIKGNTLVAGGSYEVDVWDGVALIVDINGATSVVTSVNGQTGAVTIPALPTVSSSDNGKFLRVVSGVWAAATVSNASGVSF